MHDAFSPKEPVSRSSDPSRAAPGACVDCGRPIWPQSRRCPACAHRAQSAAARPPLLNQCVDCGHPISIEATRCRACARLTLMRHGAIIPGCPFPRGDPAAREPRVLTAEERRWVRTIGARFSARSLAQYFGVHPTTMARIRAQEDSPDGEPPRH